MCMFLKVKFNLVWKNINENGIYITTANRYSLHQPLCPQSVRLEQKNKVLRPHSEIYI